MDGPDLIYRGILMGHFSFKIGTWMGDGWWHFKIPKGTPLPRPKLSTPGGVTHGHFMQTYHALTCVFQVTTCRDSMHPCVCLWKDHRVLRNTRYCDHGNASGTRIQ